MKTTLPTLLCLTLVPTLALAGSLRDAQDALGEAIDRAGESDARCARPLLRKLDSLKDDLRAVKREELSAKRATRHAREVREWAQSECPARLRAPLDAVVDALEDSEDRPRSRRRDDDDEDRPRHRRADDDERQAPPRRDCGAGADDPGCAVSRGGALPMDGETYRGFLEATRGNPNELTRLDTVRTVLASSYITARQLGPILDSFRNELLRLDAARAAAPRTVDPQHALQHGTKFRNSLLAADFAKAMTAQ